MKDRIKSMERQYQELKDAARDYIESPVHGDHLGQYNPTDCCNTSARLREILDDHNRGSSNRVWTRGEWQEFERLRRLEYNVQMLINEWEAQTVQAAWPMWAARSLKDRVGRG